MQLSNSQMPQLPMPPEGSSAPPFLFVRTVSPEGAGEDWRCIKEVKEKLH